MQLFQHKINNVRIDQQRCSDKKALHGIECEWMKEDLHPAVVEVAEDLVADQVEVVVVVVDHRETFHKFTAKALFSSKRARQDMSPVASVLCARVKSPGRNDWNKLVRMMKFLHETRNDVLTLSAARGLPALNGT